MIVRTLAHPSKALFITVAVLFCCSLILAESPEGEQDAAGRLPSEYAPSSDLLAQIDYYMGRIGRDLSDESQFGEDQQKRIALNASTLSTICLVLGLHDEENRLKASALPLIDASQDLADAADDFGEATKALAVMQQILDNPAEETDATIEHEEVADIVLLMQQVPIVNNALRRGVGSRRFEREIERTAGHAATLAAIAQASMFDLNYTYDDESEELWQQICRDLRDASADTLIAVRAGDQEAAQLSLERIVKTCDACHDEFR